MAKGKAKGMMMKMAMPKDVAHMMSKADMPQAKPKKTKKK